MIRIICKPLWVLLLSALILSPSAAFSEPNASGPRIFGYFQTSFHHINQTGDDENSFNLQQLNVFFAKRLNPRWRAFINFEFTNTFSTERSWGNFSIEEAWLGYSPTQRLHLKAGLLIPVFNNLNEIKNKTPLLPYVIRPIVYETSFADDVGAESFTPRRAFAQIYGYLGIPKSKLDFAFYVGNSSNIISREDDDALQTGVDSTGSFLVGGRLGIRRGEFKAGVSGTYDRTDAIVVEADKLDLDPDELASVPRYRFGADFSHRSKKLMLEAEYIYVLYDIDALKYDVESQFAYFTVGYNVTEPLLVYGGYWWTGIDGFVIKKVPGIFTSFSLFTEEFDLTIPIGGVSLSLNDQVTLKGQYGYVTEESLVEDKLESGHAHFFTAAISAMF